MSFANFVKSSYTALSIISQIGPGELVPSLAPHKVDSPTLKPNQVRVEVKGTSVNIDDVHFPEGTFFGAIGLGHKPSLRDPYTPGIDFSGIVTEVGSKVTEFKVNDRVFGLTDPGRGAWGEECVTKTEFCFPMPDHWSWEDGAGIGMSATVVAGLLNTAGDIKGKECLVIGASGGNGGLLVKALLDGGAKVTGVCSDRNREALEAMGVTVVDYTKAPLGEQLKPGAFDLGFDCVGGEENQKACDAAIKNGKYMTIVGPQKYNGDEKHDFRQVGSLLGKISLNYAVSRLKGGPEYHFVAPLQPDKQVIMDKIVNRDLKPSVDRIVDLSDIEGVKEGIEHVESHRAKGKVLLRMDSQFGNMTVDDQNVSGEEREERSFGDAVMNFFSSLN